MWKTFHDHDQAVVGSQDVQRKRKGMRTNVWMEWVDTRSDMDGMEDAKERRAVFEPSQREVFHCTLGIVRLKSLAFVQSTFQWSETGTNVTCNEGGSQPC